MIWTSSRDVEVGGTTLDRLLVEGAGRLIDGPTGAVVDADLLRERVAAVSSTLAGLGFGRGDALGLLAPNVPAWAGVALGAMAAGGAVTPLSMLATETELAAQIADAGASIVVTIPSLADKARAAGARHVLAIGPDVLAGGGTPEGAHEGAAAFVPYSSGTTGLPKGVVLTHSNLVTSVRQADAGLRMTERDVVLAVAPFSHIMGFVLTLAVPLSRGSTVVTMPRFDPAAFFGHIERYRVTVLVVPPPVLPLIADSRADLSSLQFVASGGARVDPDVQRALQARLPRARVGQGYGMTETAANISCPDRDRGGVPGSVGRLMPNTELCVVDPETGARLGTGEAGELWVRGPQNMAGYLGRPDDTAATIDAEGWLHTGDLGFVDADGGLHIVDRLKELIKVNAYQVAPAELEAVLMGHPAVADAAVVGRPDDACGEVPVAFAVATGQVDGDELAAWVAERVAPYKRPSVVHVVDAIPRTPSGKVLRRLLAEGAPV